MKAKFKCQSVQNFEHSKKAELFAVYGNSEENKDYSKATPSGNLTIGIDESTPAIDFFIPDKEYYLEFTQAE